MTDLKATFHRKRGHVSSWYSEWKHCWIIKLPAASWHQKCIIILSKKCVCLLLSNFYFKFFFPFFVAISSTPTSTVGIQQSSQIAPQVCKDSEKIETASVISHNPGSIAVANNYSNLSHDDFQKHVQCHIQQQPLQAQASLQQPSPQPQQQQQVRQQRTRLRSLDTFRGWVTIFC